MRRLFRQSLGRVIVLPWASFLAFGAGEAPLAPENEQDARNHFGLFAGGATRFEEGEKLHGFAVGMEYERRISVHWGVGGLAEALAGGEGRALALVIPMSWHPWRGLRLAAGPGIEVNEGSAEFLGRISAGYDFEVRRLSIAPEISADFGRGVQTLTYGITLGLRF